MAVECVFNFGNAVVTLAGVALGGVIGFLSARHISDRNAIAVAIAKLRAAFAPSLNQLNLGRMNNNCPDDLLLNNFLKDELPKLAIALEEFKFFVSDCDRAAYQEAWLDYYKTINDGGVAIVRAYNEDDPWSVIEMKIHKLTAFAKIKSAVSCCSPAEMQ